MTDMIPAEETVLKTDKLGRVQRSVARREQLLDEFERSGLSGVKFAELTGVKYQTLATWLKKRRRTRERVPTKMPVKDTESMRWLEAVVEATRPAGGKNPLALVLELPGGARLEIGSLKQIEMVAALLWALAKPC